MMGRPPTHGATAQPDAPGAPKSAHGGDAAPAPARFGKYLLLEQRAVGGMAEVWLGKIVRDDGVSDLLAVKRILPKHTDDEEFLRMFVDEARIAGQLSHPGIVAIDELGKIGASLYLAMEFVWGRDLLEVIARARALGAAIDPVTAAYIAAKMCEALHYAHTRVDRHGRPLGVVHRDVSPQNVLVSFDGRVKLIDFGIAKASSRASKTDAGTLKGKVGYMSPEQVEGAPVDHRSDQFAVGTCLFEMLTGRPLFSRPNHYETLELVRAAKVPSLASLAPRCPPRLVEVAMRALSKAPEARFATAHELQKALMKVVADEDPSFERVTLTAWIRELFRDEIAEEKRRLDALDAIGRPAPSAHGKRRQNESTRLEIGAQDLFDDDEDAETQIFDESPLVRAELDGVREAPHEVFFQRDGARSAQAARPSLGPYRRRPATHAVAPAAWTSRGWSGEPRPPSGDFLLEPGGEDAPPPQAPSLELNPRHLDTQVLRAILPTLRAGGADETGRTHGLSAGAAWVAQALRGWRRRDLALAGAAALLAVGLGAAATYALVGGGAAASLEVRTNTPNPAVVRLDGVAIATTPARIEGIRPGTHALVVEAAGHVPMVRTVELAPRATIELDVVLVPAR